jgi:hypothetical protein
VTQKETRLVTDVLYRRWFPEVFYDVHQQGSDGMRLTLSPYVDPIDPNIDPLIVRAINHVGATMALALEARGKSGVGDGVTYDLWWHGGRALDALPAQHGGAAERGGERADRDAHHAVARQPEGSPARLPQVRAARELPQPVAGGTWRLRGHHGLRG